MSHVRVINVAHQMLLFHLILDSQLRVAVWAALAKDMGVEATWPSLAVVKDSA